MSFFEFPHTRTYDSDLGWLIRQVKKISVDIENFISLNEIKYADPFQWNITRSYGANTMVVDPDTGTAYLSVKAVPAGVLLSDTDYWTPVFDYDGVISDLEDWVRESTVYANVRAYGAAGDGVTDDSAAFQAAIDSGKVVYVPAGEYLVHDVTASGNIRIIGGENAVIHPYYVNGIAQNVFYFENGTFAAVEHIDFIGTLNGANDTSVQRQSTIEAENFDCVIIRDCIFDSIDNSDTGIETLLKNRRGICLTLHDVKHSVIDHVTITRTSRDEACWIAPKNILTIDECFVDIIDCHSHHFGGWSIFNVVADRVNVVRYVSDSTDNTNGASFMNLLCNDINVKECTFKGRCSEVIDNRESNAFFGRSAVFEDCIFDNFTSIALILFAKNIVVNRCYVNGRNIIQSINTPTTDPDVINIFGPIAYTSYMPVDRIIVKDTKFNADNSISGTSWISMIYIDHTEANVYVENCNIDCHNIAGSTIWARETSSLVLKNNKLRNASNILSSSSIQAYMDLGVDNVRIDLENNDADKTILALFGSGCEMLNLVGNTVNGYAGAIADNYGNGNAVGKLNSDTTQIRIYADNYTTTNGSFLASSWSAENSSAYGTELTNRLTLKKGLYIITAALPASTGALPARLRNFTAAQDFGPIITLGTYGSGVAVLAVNTDDSEIGFITQGSTSVTFTNITNAGLTAIPVKF